MTSESKLTTELIERKYWACNETEHRHQSADVANRCIAGSKVGSQPRRFWKEHSSRAVFQRIIDGETCSAVGLDYQLGQTRINQIARKYGRLLWSRYQRCDEDKPEAPAGFFPYGIREIQKHAVFWQAVIQQFGKE